MGIFLNKDNFKYSLHVNNYMTSFLENMSNSEIFNWLDKSILCRDLQFLNTLLMDTMGSSLNYEALHVYGFPCIIT